MGQPAHTITFSDGWVECTADDPSKVDQIDVFVVGPNGLEEDAVGLRQDNDAPHRARLTMQGDMESGLFPNFADGSFVRQLVGIDVPAGRQPHL